VGAIRKWRARSNRTDRTGQPGGGVLVHTTSLTDGII
jgi:hypothetical protein